MHKYVFTDTNLFEQFQPITDIDWLKLASCDHVTLMVPIVTIRELNEHKDGASRGRLKRKAAAALITLKTYSDQGIPAQIRNGVDLEIRSNEPLVDFGSYHLDPKLNDDRLIASAIEFAIERQIGPESVLIATGDFGLELKAKGQYLLRPLSLPPELRLIDEPDQEEVKIKDLEDEIRRLKNSTPDLNLTFNNNETFIKIALEPPLELHQDKIDEQLERLRCNYPLLDTSPPSALSLMSALVGASEMVLTYNAEYNDGLAGYYTKVENYYRDILQYRNRQRLTIQLSFILNNIGRAPADDIRIELHFPDGFSVLDADDEEEEPAEPKPPLMPRERFARSLAIPNIAMSNLNYSAPALPSRLAVSNSRLEGIKKTNSYFVTFSVDKVMHTLFEELPPIRIRFDFHECVKPFGIRYRIVAGNLPTPVNGILHVIVSVEGPIA